MPSFRSATVVAELSARPGLQRVETDLGRAYVLTDLTGPVEVGDRVVVNTTAVELGLGTGGWHVVHWNLERESWAEAGPGHIMKLRYTSLQADTGAVEELEAGVLAEATDLGGLPVVACGLHSQVPCVAAALKHAVPDAKVAYVMTDGAALPMALSDLVVAMRAAGLVDATLTAGQAFGGEHEAVNVPSALLAARHVAGADVAIVGMGPGVVGTATTFGYSAVEVGPVLDAADLLGGRPVAALRFSLADERLRHQGVSHHTRTALSLATRARATIGIPKGAWEDRVRADLDAAGLGDRHRVVAVDDPDVPALLERLGVHVTTMGRGPTDDPGFYAVAGAAGTVAASLIGS
ncbi:MAG: hypothetical protein JWN67_3017 [Actinomycetia bacterium]|nr:hypothetical protein [Actinomycetes bacterium]